MPCHSAGPIRVSRPAPRYCATNVVRYSPVPVNSAITAQTANSPVTAPATASAEYQVRNRRSTKVCDREREVAEDERVREQRDLAAAAFPAPHRRPPRACRQPQPSFLQPEALRLARPSPATPGARASIPRHGTVHPARSLIATAALLAAGVPGARTASAQAASAQARDWSREAARTAPAWVRDAVVYEVFPRDFSAEGNLAGVTARLDHVRDLGATVVWLMPIHPIGAGEAQGHAGQPVCDPRLLRRQPRLRHAGRPDAARPRGTRARPARDPGRRREPHLVGQRDDEDNGALRSRRERTGAAAERRLVRRREARLCESRRRAPT